MKYFPFGEARTDLTNVNTDKLFTGQRLDQTDLYYYNARYYDASIGRFISPDSIVPDPFNPQSLNRYSYCLNNPLRYVDPSGHWVWGHNTSFEYSGSLPLAAEWVQYDIQDNHGGHAFITTLRIGASLNQDLSLGLFDVFFSSHDSVIDYVADKSALEFAVDFDIPRTLVLEGEISASSGSEFDGDFTCGLGGEVAMSFISDWNISGYREFIVDAIFTHCPYTGMEAPNIIREGLGNGFEVGEFGFLWYNSGNQTGSYGNLDIPVKVYLSFLTLEDCLLSIMKQPYEMRKKWGFGNFSVSTPQGQIHSSFYDAVDPDLWDVYTNGGN